ncbi:hypothetical protein HanPI659440_Chr04g0145371 [Helianthus annuus]|nr:hypothetical protein HanPI659440_Chr04g0145371 [Helianthus annuus]
MADHTHPTRSLQPPQPPSHPPLTITGKEFFCWLTLRSGCQNTAFPF